MIGRSRAGRVISPCGARRGHHGPTPLLLLTLVAAAALAVPPAVLANGGIARLVRAPVGPYLVTVYSSPTPLRTGEVDVSVMVQDSTNELVDVAIEVEAVPLRVEEGGPSPETVRREATRQQATNKLFKAAKFDIEAPGDWRFRVRVESAGEVEFEAPVVRSTILDRPYLLAVLILAPVLLIGWLLAGREEDERAGGGDESPGQSRSAATM